MLTSSDPSDAVLIRAENLGKRYRLWGHGPRHTFWALHEVSFEIRRGEKVGLLGLNGGGKSTLLKILSRITTPTTGEAEVKGRMGSLLEVGTGFHPELTGRENVFLYGSILGMPKAEIARKFDAIVAFAEVADFIETPVKRYSSGMYVRLAFAVAAHLEPDILLLDEVMAVGDLPFQRKSMEFARSQLDATILFVSHNASSVRTMCDRVIYLKSGRIAFDGPTDAGIERYEADCRQTTAARVTGEAATGSVTIADVALLDESGVQRTVFDHGERMRIRFAYACEKPVEAPNFIVAFIRSDGVACCSYSSELDGASLPPGQRSGTVELITPPLALVSELYRVEILVRDRGFQKLLGAAAAGSFHVRHPLLDAQFGVFREPGRWEVLRPSLAERGDAAPVRVAS